MSYRAGDFYLISDRSGKKIRASESRREWNGSIVHKDEYDSRHPQERIRSTRDQQSVKNPRPRATDSFVGAATTEVNATHAAGETTITVLSSTNFAAAAIITIMLDSGNAHRAVVSSVPGSTSIILTVGLPGSTSASKAVVNHSNVTAATL